MSPQTIQQVLDILDQCCWTCASLRNAINEFLAHYHHERNHQGLGNRLIDPGEEVGVTEGSIACRERLGGLLRYYYREAA